MEPVSNRPEQTSQPLPEPLAIVNPSFIDGIQAALIVIDREHRILMTNRYTQTWVKRASEEMRGQHCYRLFHDLGEVCSDCPASITFRTGETTHAVHTGIDKEGGTTYAELTTHPIKDDRGEVLYVIEYVRDASERMRFEEEILDRNKRLSALNNIANIVSGSLDVDEMLQQSLARLIEAVQGDGGCFLLLNDSGDELVLKSYLGLSREFVEAPEMSWTNLSNQITCTVVVDGKPVVVKDLQTDPRAGVEATREGIQALASVPLRSRSRVLGMINVIRRENQEFNSGDIDLLVAAGNQIGIAIENASLIHSLAESETRYRTMVENSNDVIWALDRSGNFVWSNRRGEEISGHKLGDWVGKSFAPLIVPEDLPMVQKVFADVMAGYARSYEVRIYRKDGGIFVLLVNTTPIFSDGEVVGTVSFGKDITERKEAEEALRKAHDELEERVQERTAELGNTNEELLAEIAERKRVEELVVESEEKYRNLVELTPDIIYGSDENDNQTFANDAAFRILEAEPEDVLDQPWLKWVHPDDREETVKKFQEMVEQGIDVFEFENRLVSKRGVVINALHNLRILRNEKGRTIGTQGIVRNITRRKQAEKALHDSEERLRAIIDNSTSTIYLKDTKGAYILVNPQFEKTAHLTKDEILGRTDYDLFPKETADSVRENDLRVIETAAALEFEETAILPDGIHTFISAKFPLRDSEGAIYGVCGVSTDITERKRTEQFREQYIHTVSHDMRNPLAIIQGHAQFLQRLLEKAGRDEREHRSVEAIVTSTKRMNAMIQDLVDSARLEAGQLDLDKQPVSLGYFVSEMLGRARGVMDVGRVQVDCPVDLPPVSADPNRLERIFMNLLSNALKYSPSETGVLIKADGMDGEVKISITDHGMGIAHEDLPHIFERFYRAKAVRKPEGVGLGLYITGMLVEAHGGHIWVDSQLGKGSTFYFTLSLA